MMEQENNPEQVQEGRPLIGHLLRERRISMGLDIEDVVAKIKLSHHQVVALEENDFKALPEIVFLRGFVRSYARLLQMDELALLAHLPDAQVTQVRTEPNSLETAFPTEKTARRQSVRLLLAALLVGLVIMGFVQWQAKMPHHAAEVVKSDETVMPLTLPNPVASAVPESHSEPMPETPPVANLPEASPVSAVAVEDKTVGKASLRLVFDKECWVEIKDKYGKTLSKQVNAAGSELRLDGKAPFDLVIGHAKAVRLFYQDKPVDLDPYINASSDVARLTLE
jgi:cytoskeleton protein RodZ